MCTISLSLHIQDHCAFLLKQGCVHVPLGPDENASESPSLVLQYRFIISGASCWVLSKPVLPPLLVSLWAGSIYAMLYGLNKHTYSSLLYTGDVISELYRSLIISRLCSLMEAKLFEAGPCWTPMKKGWFFFCFVFPPEFCNENVS